jgi:hypothetical protein
MTNKFEELATQAGLKLDDLPDDVFVPLEKFAELIVRECAIIADTAEPYKSNDLILKHFGVEE